LKSGKSEKSNATSRNSVQERKRVVEEANLEMQALQERQELQRELEEVDKGRAELSRKLELFNARTKVKRAEIDSVVEQNVEGETKDGMNEYLKQHHAQNHLSNEALLPPSMNGATPTSKSQAITSEKEMSTPLAELNFAQSQLSVSSAQSPVETEPVVNLSSTPCVVSAVSKASSEKVSAVTLPHSVECERIASSAARLSLPKTTIVYTTTSVPVYTLAGLSPIRNQSTPKTSTQSQSRQSTGLNADTAEFYPVIASQQTTPPLVNYPSPLDEGQSSMQSQQSDAWMTIAQAIKQGPSLPKVELMKFSGDPSEYAEFLTNFRDNIESEVSDESQRLTRLLAQCTGKVKEAIRSCVNLPVGQRYSEAWRTLRENFGQPHMIVKAHMKKLREIQVRKADASSLMEFVRRLEDARRVLASMSFNYTSHLDNEDVIFMLMKKLPDESLKKKWVDRAGDLIQRKGRAEYADFVEFVGRVAGRINNRYGQELKSSCSSERDRKESSKGKSDYQSRVTTLATRSDRSQRSSDTQHRAPQKCAQCSGLHGVWRC